MDDEPEKTNDDDEQNLMESPSSHIYLGSCFWQKYHAMARNVIEQNNIEHCLVNEYHSKSFLFDFLKKCIEYLPLANTFLVGSRDLLEQSNNAPGERFFNVIKNKIRCRRRELGKLISYLVLIRNY